MKQRTQRYQAPEDKRDDTHSHREMLDLFFWVDRSLAVPHMFSLLGQLRVGSVC